MNSLYTLALRQSSSLTAELALLEQSYADPSLKPPAALHGQINASLSALDRTVEDYDSMARREIVEVKKVKALSRVARFKDDYLAFRKQYERIKTTGASERAAVDRSNLLSSSSSAIQSSSSSRATSRSLPSPGPTAESPFPRYQLNNPPGSSSAFDNSVHNNSRTRSALDENGFMKETGGMLDEYLEQGRMVLEGLAGQREMLKGTKRKLLSAANTLGLSRNTIQYIERRTKGDFYILIAGATFTLFSFYMILKYLG